MDRVAGSTQSAVLQHQPNPIRFDGNIKRLQSISNTRSLDAFAAQRFIHRAVRAADEIFTIAGKELFISIIKADWDMAANILVGNQLPGKPSQEPLDLASISQKLKRHGLSIGQLFRSRDAHSFHLSKIGMKTRLKKFKDWHTFAAADEIFSIGVTWRSRTVRTS
mgnify:CR=1 FL=1